MSVVGVLLEGVEQGYFCLLVGGQTREGVVCAGVLVFHTLQDFFNVSIFSFWVFLKFRIIIQITRLKWVILVKNPASEMHAQTGLILLGVSQIIFVLRSPVLEQLGLLINDEFVEGATYILEGGALVDLLGELVPEASAVVLEVHVVQHEVCALLHHRVVFMRVIAVVIQV